MTKECRSPNEELMLILVLVIELEVRNQRSEVRDQKAKQCRTVSKFHGLNPIRGFSGGAGRAGGSMMSMTRCRIVTITAS